MLVSENGRYSCGSRELMPPCQALESDQFCDRRKMASLGGRRDSPRTRFFRSVLLKLGHYLLSYPCRTDCAGVVPIFALSALDRLSESVLSQSRSSETVFVVRLEPKKYDNVVPQARKWVKIGSKRTTSALTRFDEVTDKAEKSPLSRSRR